MPNALNEWAVVKHCYGVILPMYALIYLANYRNDTSQHVIEILRQIRGYLKTYLDIFLYIYGIYIIE